MSAARLLSLAIMLRIGLLISPSDGARNDVDDLVRQAAEAAQAGMSTVWSGQGFGYDTLTALAAVGREVPGIELGAAVVPVQLRHPLVIAAQAQTVHAASGGRLVLGLGVSHPVLMEKYGVSTDKPVRMMREYLTTLMPVLRGGRTRTDVAGTDSAPEGLDEMLSSTAVRGATPTVPVLLGALGPAMLRVAGELADGTVTFLVGPRTLGGHVVPTITEAAEAAGRPAPRVVACLPVAVTHDVQRVRAEVARGWAVMAAMPSYRAMLERESAVDAGQVAVAGDESAVLAELQRLTTLGVADFYAVPVGTTQEQHRTLRLLSDLTREQ
jgi:F420-dependent oxidoreductase-like protein